jgi:hypothetical protein
MACIEQARWPFGLFSFNLELVQLPFFPEPRRVTQNSLIRAALPETADATIDLDLISILKAIPAARMRRWMHIPRAS